MLLKRKFFDNNKKHGFLFLADWLPFTLQYNRQDILPDYLCLFIKTKVLFRKRKNLRYFIINILLLESILLVFYITIANFNRPVIVICTYLWTIMLTRKLHYQFSSRIFCLKLWMTFHFLIIRFSYWQMFFICLILIILSKNIFVNEQSISFKEVTLKLFTLSFVNSISLSYKKEDN